MEGKISPSNPLNVFKGPNALDRYFDPDENPPLPLIEIPPGLNPYVEDGVRVFAKMMTALPAQNVKCLPDVSLTQSLALKMLQNQPNARNKTIVEASSGSTVLSLGIIARALWEHDDVHAYVTNKKPLESLKMLRFMGLKIVLYGGLAQQEPSDPKGIMHRLRKKAMEDERLCYLGQYDNNCNWQSHEQWTGRQIWKQLPEINVFCGTVGTGGCVVGTGAYLKARKPSVRVVGICNTFGDPTPGPRHFPGFESSSFPWRSTIDTFRTVDSVDSYRTSMRLSRYGIISGPSSGEALHGLIEYIRQEKAEGRLGELRSKETGEISCVFICADLPYQYLDTYFKKLGDAEFPEVCNKELLNCDLDPYDERWFLFPSRVKMILQDTMNAITLERSVCLTPKLCDKICLSSISSADEALSVSSSSPSLCSHNTNNSASSTPSTAASPSSISSSISSRSYETGSYFPDSRISLAPPLTILDIRPGDEFAISHLRGARNIPLPLTIADFFGNAQAVKLRHEQLKEALIELESVHRWQNELSHSDEQSCANLENASCAEKILVVCHDGDSSRMAVAMLRARGYHAFSVDGGYTVLEQFLCGEKTQSLFPRE